MDDTAEQRLEDRLEKGLRDVREALQRIEEKLDARHEKLEERVRGLEARMAQIWILGGFATFVVGPAIAYIIGKIK